MTLPGAQDPQEWLKDYQQRIAALKEKAEKAKTEMADNRVELTSENGHVKLAVTGAGALQSLEITDSASSAKPSELGKTIMQTYRKAVSQAGARTMEIMSDLGGPNSQAMDIVKDAIPPEPEADEQPGSATTSEVDQQAFGIAQDDDEESTSPPAQSAQRPSSPTPPVAPPAPSRPLPQTPAAEHPSVDVDFEDEEDVFQGVWDTDQ